MPNTWHDNAASFQRSHKSHFFRLLCSRDRRGHIKLANLLADWLHDKEFFFGELPFGWKLADLYQREHCYFAYADRRCGNFWVLKAGESLNARNRFKTTSRLQNNRISWLPVSSTENLRQETWAGFFSLWMQGGPGALGFSLNRIAESSRLSI